jgi:hypothetical protein
MGQAQAKTENMEAGKVKKIIRQSRNDSGTFYLVRLPLGMGFNIGKGFSGFYALRSYEWAAFDHADHQPERTRWGARQLAQSPEASHPFAARFDTWDSRRFWQRMKRTAERVNA